MQRNHPGLLEGSRYSLLVGANKKKSNTVKYVQSVYGETGKDCSSLLGGTRKIS